ncbi:MAG: hypothetical protein ACRD43_05585, partial [Pyrinomonadaceae bacterium]
MKRQFLIFIILGLLGFAGTAASQNVSPTPAPVPTPIPSPTPVGGDKQNVQPENLQGVPKIAPNYSSDDRSLPDLGQVGVDMAEQKSLALRDAIAMALENNKDIEVTRQNVKIAEFDLQAARGVY